MIVRCYLAPSGIEGLGAFAHDDIEASDKVWRYDRSGHRHPLQRNSTR